MKRLKSIVTVLLIFLSGVVVGGIMAAGATMHDFVNKTFRDGPPGVRRVLLQRAKHDLKLDEDQSHQFWQIFNETGAELRDVLAPVRPQMESTLRRAEQRLREVLKNHQLPPFEKFLKTAIERWRPFLERGAPAVERAPEHPGIP